MRSTEKLVAALKAANAPGHIIKLAEEDYYHDYNSPLPNPIVTLVGHCRRYGLNDVAEQAIKGEFDATREESDEWAASPEGRATIRSLTYVSHRRKK